MQIYESSEEQRAIASAKDPFVSPSANRSPKRLNLLALFEHTSVGCLTRIAENSSIPQAFLEQLALHQDPRVREAVADNLNTPIDTLMMLASDACEDVRYAMSENHNLPFEILQALCLDQNPYVATRAQATVLRVSRDVLVVTVDFEDRGGGRAVLRSS